MVNEKYAILKKAMRLGLDAAKTGAPASDVAAAINGMFVEAGYEKYCRPPFMRVRGHGLGCGSSAPGNLEDENKTKLRTGHDLHHPSKSVSSRNGLHDLGRYRRDDTIESRAC